MPHSVAKKNKTKKIQKQKGRRRKECWGRMEWYFQRERVTLAAEWCWDAFMQEQHWEWFGRTGRIWKWREGIRGTAGGASQSRSYSTKGERIGLFGQSMWTEANPRRTCWRIIIHKARRGVTPRLHSKHTRKHDADHILHFILKAMGHKRNANFKGVGNPCPENQAYFFLSLRQSCLSNSSWPGGDPVRWAQVIEMMVVHWILPLC